MSQAYLCWCTLLRAESSPSFNGLLISRSKSDSLQFVAIAVFKSASVSRRVVVMGMLVIYGREKDEIILTFGY